MSSGAVEAALIDWINAFPIEPKVTAISELSDGDALSKVLYDIDPYYFRTILAGSGDISSSESHWTDRYHRLKKIHKELERYYTETLGNTLPSGGPNITNIAKDGNKEDLTKLLKIFVAAAVQSDRREEYVKQIQDLSPSSQEGLMLVINQMLEPEEPEVPTHREHRAAEDFMDLRLEEELGRLMSAKEAVDNENMELKKRFERLQASYDENQKLLSELQDQYVEPAHSGGYGAGGNNRMLETQLDNLQDEVRKLEDIITEKENIIRTNDSTISSLNRKIDDILPKAEMATKWKDELDEQKHMVEKLRKSHNVAEKYRKKLEGMTDLERQIKLLEEQLAKANKTLRENDETSKQLPGQRKLVDQYKKQMEKLENENAALLLEKHKLEIDNEMLRDKVSGVETQISRDMEQIQTLEEKIRDLESGIMRKDSDDNLGGGDLDSELTFTTRTKTDLKLQVQRLQKEIAQLKADGGPGADLVMVKSLLDDSQKAREKLEKDYLQSHGEKLILESQLTALKSGVSVEGSEVLLKLRESVVSNDAEISKLRKQVAELEADLSVTKRALITAQSDLSMVGKDEAEQLEILKAANSEEVVALRQELEDLQKKAKSLEADLEQHKSLLNTALLEKDEVSKKLAIHQDGVIEAERTIAELKSTLAALEGNAEGRDGALEKRVIQLQNKLEDQREKMVKSREHIKKQNAIIKDLKDSSENGATVSRDDDERLKDKEDQIQRLEQRLKDQYETLNGELGFITAAWWDLSNRMQLNPVAVQRKIEPQNSWLNKQRIAVTRNTGKMGGSGQ